MNGGNKIALEIRLLGESSLEIVFLHWDKRFLSDYNDKNNIKFVYYLTDDRQFSIYSHEEGDIIGDEYQFGLVVPDIDHMKNGYVLSHSFKNDDMRFKFLKSMYEHVVEWATEWEIFKNDNLPKHKFIVHQQYWIY